MSGFLLGWSLCISCRTSVSLKYGQGGPFVTLGVGCRYMEETGEDSPVSVDMVQSIGGTYFNIIGTRGLELN